MRTTQHSRSSQAGSRVVRAKLTQRGYVRSTYLARGEVADLTRFQVDRIFARDGFRCVRCGSPELTLQHRRAKGMGGLGEKSATLVLSDGLSMCMQCNQACEAGGQDEALRCGWKLHRNSLVPSYDVPYYERRTGNWYLPDSAGGRKWVDPVWASERVQLALAA